MRREFFLIYTFAIVYVHSLSCTNKNKEHGHCSSVHDCVPALNSFKINQIYPDAGTCDEDEDEVCCVENYKGLKIHEKKCYEYFTSAFEEKYIPAEDPEDPPEKIKIDKCTVASTSFIVKGELAEDHEFPHMASIGDNSQNPIYWFCGGSLLSENFVLSASHCFKNNARFQARIVRLGVNNLVEKKDTQVDASVMRIFKHPGFRDETAYNDIALLQLTKRIQFTPYVRPACLPSEPFERENFIASGWGATEQGGLRSNVLMKVVIDAYDRALCNKFYGNKYLQLRQGVNDNFICLKDPKGEKDTCQGDSGTGVVALSRNVYCSYIIYGVTSAGVGCGIGYPTLYTNVHNYVDWISSVVWR